MLNGRRRAPTAQLGIIPPEEGARYTQRTRPLTGNVVTQVRMKVSRPTAGPLSLCQWPGTEQLCADPQASGRLSPAPHDTETPKVANGADKQPPFTLYTLLPWLPEKDHQYLHSKMEKMGDHSVAGTFSLSHGV